MQNNESIKPTDFEVHGPVSPTEASNAAKAFQTQGADVAGQYENCRQGGERGKVLLYHLVSKQGAEPVGFIGFETHTEDFDDGGPKIAWISVEYLYLLPKYRARGLSSLLFNLVQNESKKWLRSLIRKYSSSGIICNSGCAPISDEGQRFVDRTNAALRKWCTQQNVQFRP